MNKFYCNKCKKEVELYNGRCPICKTNWENIEEKCISNVNTKSKITNNHCSINEIEEIFDFFIKIADVVQILFLIVASIIAIYSIYSFEEIIEFIIMIFVAGIFILFGVIFEKSFKWKAYMLRTNYEISLNRRV